MLSDRARNRASEFGFGVEVEDLLNDVVGDGLRVDTLGLRVQSLGSVRQGLGSRSKV